MDASTKKIIEENEQRHRQLFPDNNPITGHGSFVERKPLRLFEGKKEILLPVPFFETELVQSIQAAGSIPELARRRDKKAKDLLNEFNDLRKDYDFEFWAATTVKIEDKKTRKMVPFILRSAQRKLLWELEKMRLAGDPIRLILLKARQWGGSTLVQIYMSWIQVCKRTRWHSAIVAEDENQARNIRNMYTRLARHYPVDAGTITFTPYEGSSKNRIILERGSIVGIGSINKPDSLRSFSFMMLHLSEVGVWKSTPQRSAENLMQSLRGMVELDPYTIIVMESTAKGVGNLFHREWKEAEQGTSLYVPFFVAWWEIEIYRKPVEDPEAFIQTWGAYEWELWELGATIEGIRWYRMKKRGENYDDWRMKEEYPSTAEEAFQSSGRRVFHPAYVLNARRGITEPKAVGELFADGQKGKEALENIEFGVENEGNLRIWQFPDDLKTDLPTLNRFCAFVDVGGRSEKSDYSVVSVFDRYWMMEGGLPERVATWRGHLDQDLFAWKAAQIAKWYQNALLAIETNSLRKEKEQSEGDHSLTILDEIKEHYYWLYTRTDREKVNEGQPLKYGFHTNTATKTMIINRLIAATRDEEYVERDEIACDEMDYYEIKEDGTMGAKDGTHDDVLITTAGGIWLALNYMQPVQFDKTAEEFRNRKPRRQTEAMI